MTALSTATMPSSVARQVSSIWWLMLFGVVFFLPTIKFGLSYEFSLVPAAVTAVVLGGYLLQDGALERMDIILLLLLASTLVALFVFLDANVFKDLLFVLMLYGGVIWSRRYRGTSLEVLSVRVLWVYLAVAVLESLVPEVSVFKTYILTRFFYSAEGPRGVSSLATEPSYYALVVFACWLVCYSGNKFDHVPVKFMPLALVSLIFTKSTMAVLILPLLMLTVDQRYRARILMAGALLVIGVAVVGVSVDSRATQLLGSLYAEGFEFLFRDDSAASRLFFIIKDLDVSWRNGLLPLGPGSYDYAITQYDLASLIPYRLLSLYDFSMSGSLLGHFLVEFGMLTVVLLMAIYVKLTRSAGYIGALGVTLLVSLLLLQMISLVFAPIAFALGIFAQRLFEASE
jgi:hypothetical protein